MSQAVRRAVVVGLGVLWTVSSLVAAPPAKPTFLRPMGYQWPESAVQVSFEWESSGATWHQIWIQRNGVDYSSGWEPQPYWLCDHDLPAGDYHWWVRTWNADGLSLWSDGAWFIKTKAPNVFETPDDVGLYGYAGWNFGVYGNALYHGVRGRAYRYGVSGVASEDYGVYGNAGEDYGVYGDAQNDWGGAFTSGSGKTLKCWGDAYVTGDIHLETGTKGLYRNGVFKAFTIDHPLEPKTKVLRHFCAEGPEAVVMYRGDAVIGNDGKVTVELPDYFDALTRKAHVQLTSVGTDGVYVGDDISGNTFSIAGPAATKVYWTVTAERDDPKARLERRERPVEQKKGTPGTPAKGEYISPECY